jgi:hypothetical protein
MSMLLDRLLMWIAGVIDRNLLTVPDLDDDLAAFRAELTRPSSALSTEGHSEIVPPTAAKNPVRRPAGRVARYRRSGRTCRQADR